MRIPLPNIFLAFVAVFAGAPFLVPAKEESPFFAVKFTRKGAEFSGKVDSEETGQKIAEAVHSVRPDLPILNKGITVDSDVVLPPFADLKALIEELGISTHEGGVAIWDDAVLLSGLTDSVITLTALKIRLGGILEGRQLINRICIVPSDDLPDLSIKLSSGETVGPLLDFEVYPEASEAFTPPGIPIGKLYAVLSMLADPSPLDENAPETSDDANLRAVPLMTSTPSPPDSGAAKPTMLRAVPAPPANTYVALEPIRFARNSFLLQANQQTSVAQTVQKLNEPPLAGHRVLIQAVKPQTSSGAYGDYLLEKRTEQTRKLLTDGGVSPGRLLVRNGGQTAEIDAGEVRIVVEIPPPPAPPEDDDEKSESVESPEIDSTGSGPPPNPVESAEEQ